MTSPKGAVPLISSSGPVKPRSRRRVHQRRPGQRAAGSTTRAGKMSLIDLWRPLRLQLIVSDATLCNSFAIEGRSNSSGLKQ
jgi:hypothetical protein